MAFLFAMPGLVLFLLSIILPVGEDERPLNPLGLLSRLDGSLGNKAGESKLRRGRWIGRLGNWDNPSRPSFFSEAPTMANFRREETERVEELLVSSSSGEGDMGEIAMGRLGD